MTETASEARLRSLTIGLAMAVTMVVILHAGGAWLLGHGLMCGGQCAPPWEFVVEFPAGTPQSQVTRAIDDCSHFAFVQSVDARMDAPIGSGPGPRIWTYPKEAGQVAQLRHCVLAGGAQWIAMPA